MGATDLIMGGEPLMRFFTVFLIFSAITAVIIFIGDRIFDYLKAYRKREAILNFEYEYEQNGKKTIVKETKKVTILYFPPPRLQNCYFFVKIKNEKGEIIYYNSKIIKSIEFL